MTQAYFCEGSEAMVALEGMIDASSLTNVVYALAHICREKASHLESNWGDKESARVWEKDARRFDKLAMQIES